MSYLDLYEKTTSESVAGEGFPTRRDSLERIRQKSTFDVVVIGGGVHGAAFARLAAFNGLSTVLFERGDYAGETSSRSSKMVHGGLRYLELLDFAQVIEGVKAREDLFQIAPHLAQPCPFLIPVKRGNWFEQLKFRLGLTLYDRFMPRDIPGHRWRPFAELHQSPWRARGDFAGAFEYRDGVMDDARIVQELIVSARQEGAECLNYVSAERVGSLESGEVRVFCKDLIGQTSFDVKAGFVVNCAGPWVREIGQPQVETLKAQPQLKFSRGVHVLFETPWPHPALFLPLAGRGRYYFVWPHPGGAMVGTTEQECGAPERAPQPTVAELDEIFARLERDLPDAGLDRAHAYYAFAGVRTLPLRSGAENTSKLSRRHIWSYANGMLSLFGGKYTTALSTAEEGLRTAVRLAGAQVTVSSLKGRRLPGASGASLDEAKAVFEGQPIPEEIVAGVVRRLGTRVRFLPHFERWFEIFGGIVLRGEIELYLESEQVETLEDLMWRRLGFELLPGHGLAALDEIVALMKTRIPGRDFDTEAGLYRAKIAATRDLLKRGALSCSSLSSCGGQ